MFTETLNKMTEFEGRVKVAVTPTGDVDPRFLIEFLMELKGDVIMSKAAAFVAWDVLNEVYDKSSEEDQQEILKKFKHRFSSLKIAYEKDATIAQSPKIVTPSNKIVTA